MFNRRSAGTPARPPRSFRSRRHHGHGAPWWELPVLVALAIAVAILVKSFVVQPFYIPSASMEKTLHGCPTCTGDRILVNKPIYHLRDPHPGDIVVFRAPPGWDSELASGRPGNPVVRGVRWFGQLVGVIPPDEKDLVKRVIAVGGQTIQCCDAEGHVQISDHGPGGPWRSLIEPYIFQGFAVVAGSTPGAPAHGDRATFGPVTIPAGRLWVMGDHRSNSADSLFHCVSESPTTHTCSADSTTVTVKSVIGKAVVIAWPPSRWRTLGTPDTAGPVAAGPAAAGAVGAGGLPVLAGLGLVLPLRRRLWRRRQRAYPRDRG